jgi:hypothetical protein
MPLLPTALVAIVLLAEVDPETPRAPNAGQASSSSVSQAAEESRWYGWQLLASDAVAAGLWALALHENTSSGLSPALYLTGWGTYALGAATIHFANERRDLAVGRGLLRAAAPPLGFVFGLGIALSESCGGLSSDGTSDGCWYGAWAALLAPILATSIYDIATARAPAPADAWPRRPPPSVAWTPTLAQSPSGATVGFVGRF